MYWGSEEVSCEAARESNDTMAQAQTTYPGPHPLVHVAALGISGARRRRSWSAPAPTARVGVMVLANVAGRSLTEPMFAPIWAEIDRRALPVLVHPTDPPGVDFMDMGKFDLSWSVGFMFDTTLAVTRMIFDGFFDPYPNLKIIASHGGGTLPYLVGRFEKGDEVELPQRRQMKRKPHRLPAPHLLRLHHLRSRRAALPDLGRRRRPA